jgi:S-adenosylmethionine uptake transporter
MRHAHPLAPLVLAVIAIALLSVMDGVMKGASLAIGAYSAMFWRGIVGTPVTLAVWRAGGSRAWPERTVLKVHLLRGVITAAMAVLFFHSLTLLPLAQAIAISFFAPLIALYLAAVTLGERIEAKAIAASLIGLAGVGVICWPELHGGGGPGRLEGIAAVIASAFLYAWNLVLQRKQALIASPREISFFQTATTLLALAGFAPFFARWPGEAMGLIVAASAMSIVAQLLLAWAYARAEAQVLVPLEYSAFLWAAAVGWWAFGEEVTATTVAGVTLIVAGCLVAARRTPPEPVAA